MIVPLLQTLTRIGHPALGVVIPAFIFALSFFVAYALYRHFTGKIDPGDDR